MKQALMLLALAVGLLELGQILFGVETIRLVVYGAIAMMALMIAGTFLWLWVERATPLALGMVLSWTGGGVFAGWWWISELSGGAGWTEVPHGTVAVQALYLVGASLHFAVIQRSFGHHGVRFLVPIVGALCLAAAMTVLA